MADTYDNRARIEIGGRAFELAATKRAECFYAERFRDDAGALGPSDAYDIVTVDEETGDGGTLRHKVRRHIPYVGRLRADISASMLVPPYETMEAPLQVYAAIWAMARAAGSTEDSWDEFEAWLMELPSTFEQDVAAWKVVCADLAGRAFFRNYIRRDDAGQPHEGEEG